MPDCATPPADEVIVTVFGGGTLLNVMVKTPGAAGTAGPMTPVYCKPVAGLMMSRVQVNVTPGVVSVAVTTRRPLRVRYTTPVALIRMKSPVGLTTTVTVADPVRPVTLLVAVTVKVSGTGAV